MKKVKELVRNYIYEQMLLIEAKTQQTAHLTFLL